jgi:hypothetical protein
MGDLLLTDKEATGLVIKSGSAPQAPRPKWAIVGKVCSPRKLVIGALERAMQKAWGLHRSAQFRDIGENRFVVRFSSEGDWKHVKRGGPWQFDFNVVLIKDYDGSVRPSDMVFDSLDIWVRVLDLPMDMMNRAYGELIGDWVGKYIDTDVDEDGIAWGKDLRIRASIKVNQPLMWGVNPKESEDEEVGKWFDLKYEKVPHFCFDCGCLVHEEDKCQAEEDEGKQWGEWLRASPARNYKPPPPARPAVSASSCGSKSFGADFRQKDGISVRDIPPRRNWTQDQEYTSSSRTGGREQRYEYEEVVSPVKRHGVRAYDQQGGKAPAEHAGRSRVGTFTRRPRHLEAQEETQDKFVPQGTKNRKRGPKQVWLPVNVQVISQEDSRSAGKRQRMNSVFDRLEDPAAAPAMQGRRDQ